MDWKKEAMDDLKKYRLLTDSLSNIKTRINIIDDELIKPKGSTLSTIPAHGGGTAIEDKRLNLLVEKERLKHTYDATLKLVKLFDKGLCVLDDTERKVLSRFYILPFQGSLDLLMEELGYEKSHVYRIKDQALYKFTITMYGLCDY